MSIWSGFKDWLDPDYDSNLQKGQRDEEAQKAWDEYSKYKHYAGLALKEGDITPEQFNYIKGKAGANTVMNHYIDREKHPFLHGISSNLANAYYQFDQSWRGDQPWSKAFSDYWQQDEGAEDTTPLLLPWQEIKYWEDKNIWR